jgi:triosephosphate isomerase
MNKLVVGNWKQNKNLREVKDWVQGFEALVADYRAKKENEDFNVDMIVAVPFTFLSAFQDLRSKLSNFFVSAQDVSAFSGGRHTGEVGVTQLKDFVDYAIVGHSERGEDREMVYKKSIALLNEGITPIMCFKDFDPAIYTEGVVLAWEDPDNISNDSGYRAKNIDEVAEGIKRIKVQLPTDARILYGGSVNGQNAVALSNITELDGVLPGNASLDPSQFFEIIKAFDK